MVAEVCEDVMSANEGGDIVSVEFAWVKFKLLKIGQGTMPQYLSPVQVIGPHQSNKARTPFLN